MSSLLQIHISTDLDKDAILRKVPDQAATSTLQGIDRQRQEPTDPRALGLSLRSGQVVDLWLPQLLETIGNCSKGESNFKD